MSDINNDNKDKNTENNSDDELKNNQDDNSENLDLNKDENKEDLESSDDILNENKELSEKDSEKISQNIESEEKKDSVENPVQEEIKPDSKYQISLIDEENLKIRVLLDSPIVIDCNVKGSLADSGFQTNKIILTPEAGIDYKEIEVSVTLESDTSKTENFTSKKKDTNYKVNLLNDSTLKILLNTEKKLTIDCNYKDAELQDSNFNKITINPLKDNKKQEVEILLTVQEKTETKGEIIFEPGKLIPNPDVADLLETSEAEKIPMTPEEKLNDLLYKNNPFVAQRKLLQNNLLRGAVTANILFVIAIFVFYAWGSQTETIPEPKDLRRLIVLQDLPDPKINLENVEDPLKKPEEEIEDNSENPNVVIRKVTPRRFNRPPVINKNLTTSKDTSKIKDTTDFSNELDSLRKNQGLTSDSIKSGDTSLTSNFNLPDSIKRDLSENEAGFKLQYPNNWDVVDSREVNQQTDKFEGYVFADTTLKKGDLNLFIMLDNEGTAYRKDLFEQAFPMNDTTITAFKSNPRTLAGVTTIKYYLFTKTDKIHAFANIRKEFYDKYKDLIDAVVRTFTIVPPKSSGN